jgi:DNA-binding MarR family transcriptional regulator
VSAVREVPELAASPGPAAPIQPPGPTGAADPDLEATAAAILVAARPLLGMIATSILPALERITLPQLRALVLLASGGRTRIGALAQSLGVHQSTFTRTTDRLVNAGLVRRLENPDNRREVIVEATDAGLALVRAVAEQRRRELVAVLARMSAADRAVVLTGLQTLAGAAGEPPLEVLAPLGGG